MKRGCGKSTSWFDQRLSRATQQQTAAGQIIDQQVPDLVVGGYVAAERVLGLGGANANDGVGRARERTDPGSAEDGHLLSVGTPEGRQLRR